MSMMRGAVRRCDNMKPHMDRIGSRWEEPSLHPLNSVAYFSYLALKA